MPADDTAPAETSAPETTAADTTSPATDGTAETDGGPSDPKDQFKAALDAKNARAHSGPAHVDANAGSKGDTHRHGGKREFRRKSG